MNLQGFSIDNLMLNSKTIRLVEATIYWTILLEYYATLTNWSWWSNSTKIGIQNTCYTCVIGQEEGTYLYFLETLSLSKNVNLCFSLFNGACFGYEFNNYKSVKAYPSFLSKAFFNGFAGRYGLSIWTLRYEEKRYLHSYFLGICTF